MAAASAKRLLAVLFGCVLALLAVEAILQLGAAGVRHFGLRAPSPAAREDDAFRILCVGDSNTWGAGVEAREAYPARLEAALRERAPDVDLEVVNLGVPGANSAQVRERLAGYVERYAPDLLVVLVGVNDYWNASNPDGPRQGRAWVDALWLSRTFRLGVLLYDALRSPEHPPVAAEDGEGAPRATLSRRSVPAESSEGNVETEIEVSVRLEDGHREAFTNRRRAIRLDEAEHRRVLRRNLAQIVAFARGADLPLVLPTYVANMGRYAVANDVILAAEGAEVVPQTLHRNLGAYLPTDLEQALRSDPVAANAALFLPDLHPRAPTYEAFAERLADRLLAQGLVPGRP